jgi:hypothetical protein
MRVERTASGSPPPFAVRRGPGAVVTAPTSGPFLVMPALGPSQDEVNRRLVRADGLKAEPDPNLGGAINLVRPSLADARRLPAAHRATAEQQASFETFAAQRGLNARPLAVGLAPGTPHAM